MTRSIALTLIAAALVSACGPETEDARAALPSWNDRSDFAVNRITAFVSAVADPDNPAFVPAAERIAVFDNDGTLWSEKPVYFQLLFAIDRIKALASEHPEWATTQPFQAALEGDMDALAASGKKGLLELVMASHAGTTTDEFATIVRDWLRTARHPRFGRPFTDLVYQPMLELLTYLRAHGFTTYITSGGGVEFLRVWAEEVYGIPPQQVIGSSIVTQYTVRDGKPVLDRLPEIDFIDDKAGKPVAIHKFIGRRPILAVGNSDGDLQMIQWTTAGPGSRLGVIVHHTDAEREWAYDRDGHVGRLEQALDMAPARGWVVVDMKAEWRVVYPFER